MCLICMKVALVEIISVGETGLFNRHQFDNADVTLFWIMP